MKNSRVPESPSDAERQAVGGLRPGARLDLVLVHGDRARGDVRLAGDHPLPAVLDRDHAPVLDRQVGLIVHAVQALHHGLLDLLDPVGRLARLGVDLEDAVVVDLRLEALRPAAVAAQPGGALAENALVHRSLSVARRGTESVSVGSVRKREYMAMSRRLPLLRM